MADAGVDTQAQDHAREQLANSLMRIVVTEMTCEELDLAAGLLIKLPFEMRQGKPVFIKDGMPYPFSPTQSWEHYGELITSHGVVVGSHEKCEDPDDLEKITGYWYSAHSYHSGTSFEGYDLREVVGRSCASAFILQEQRVRWAREYERESAERRQRQAGLGQSARGT